jgi:riboflavin synthase alpha subunit
MNVGDFVNLEFDIVGKYVAKILKTNESLKL